MSSSLRSVRLLLAVALVVVILRTLLYLPTTPASQSSTSLRPTTSSDSSTGGALSALGSEASDEQLPSKASVREYLVSQAAGTRGDAAVPANGAATAGKGVVAGGGGATGGTKTAAYFVSQAIVADADPVVLASPHVDTAGGQEPLLRFLSMTGTSHSQLTLERVFLKHLPAADHPRRQFSSCAVVGNSGMLLRSKNGKAIDAHEAVLRFNYAPVHPYEEDVGRKTTFDFCNRENARRILHSKGFKFRNPPSTLLFFEFSSPTNRKNLFGPLVDKFASGSNRIHFLHPGFVARGFRLWNELKDEMERRHATKYHDKPMSGFYAILFLMQVCREVHLYGFEAYVSKKTAKAPYHYFDKVEGVTDHHSFDFAIYAYQLLGEEYPLLIH